MTRLIEDSDIEVKIWKRRYGSLDGLDVSMNLWPDNSWNLQTLLIFSQSKLYTLVEFFKVLRINASQYPAYTPPLYLTLPVRPLKLDKCLGIEVCFCNCKSSKLKGLWGWFVTIWCGWRRGLKAKIASPCVLEVPLNFHLQFARLPHTHWRSTDHWEVLFKNGQHWLMTSRFDVSNVFAFQDTKKPTKEKHWVVWCLWASSH